MSGRVDARRRSRLPDSPVREREHYTEPFFEELAERLGDIPTDGNVVLNGEVVRRVGVVAISCNQLKRIPGLMAQAEAAEAERDRLQTENAMQALKLAEALAEIERLKERVRALRGDFDAC